MDATVVSPFTLARRTARMNPSVIREILKITERPGIISLAGGLPSADTFPVEAMRDATARVLRDAPREALQYAASEGYGPLREWVAEHLASHQGMSVSPAQGPITNGLQQGLDLAGKGLIEADARVLVETPTYLGAVQAFTPYEPVLEGVASDEEGPLPDALAAAAPRARFAYLLPNFQNPRGHVYGEARRAALVDVARRANLALVEDNPYGDLWYDAPPPRGLASRWPEGVLYLGSFSKVLAPGLRLGYMVAPPALYPKLLQAKQAADLHTAIFNQRIVHEVLKSGMLEGHVDAIRARLSWMKRTCALSNGPPPSTRYWAQWSGLRCNSLRRASASCHRIPRARTRRAKSHPTRGTRHEQGESPHLDLAGRLRRRPEPEPGRASRRGRRSGCTTGWSRLKAWREPPAWRAARTMSAVPSSPRKMPTSAPRSWVAASSVRPTRGAWGDDPWQGWWGDDPPFHKPVFVLTHHEREPLILTDTTFTFVTDGIQAALELAREAAGDKDVLIGGGADASTSSWRPASWTSWNCTSCRSSLAAARAFSRASDRT